jgi:hypothetical protein
MKGERGLRVPCRLNELGNNVGGDGINRVAELEQLLWQCCTTMKMLAKKYTAGL